MKDGVFLFDYTPKYFKPDEFKRASPACDIKQMEPFLLQQLDRLREKVRMPVVINSAFRSVEYEKMQGRSGSSAHTQGTAVDIACRSVRNRYKLVKAALELGFTRIGIAPTYIHLDVSLTHDDEVIWLYPSALCQDL